MDFDLTDDQKQILDTVDRLMKRHYPPEEIRRRDTEHADCKDMLPVFAEAGLLALPVPGAIRRPRCRPPYRRARAGTSGAARRYRSHNVWTSRGFRRYVVAQLRHRGQRRALLPRAIKGELSFSFALTEPGAGSDAGAAITSAKKTSKGWVINGRKIWISNAGSADYLVTMCRTTPAAKAKKAFPRSSFPATRRAST